MFSSLVTLALAGTATCTCPQVLDSVADALEQNYPGYRIQLPAADDRAIHDHYLALMREQAAGLEPAACRRLVDRYLGFFDDPRLFVDVPRAETGDTPAANTESARITAGRIDKPVTPNLAARWTPDKVEFRLRREANLDPIEGLWRDSEGEFAIVYDDAIPRGEYAAFRFLRKFRTRPGEIFALLRRSGDGYILRYKAGPDDWRQARATLTASGQLTFADRGWQRTTEAGSVVADEPAAAANASAAAVDEIAPADDPLAPSLRSLGDGIFHLRIASFLPRYEQPLQSLLADSRDRLSGASLVVDLRGNGGGGRLQRVLAGWLLDAPATAGEAQAVLASSWNIEHYESLRGTPAGEGGWLEPLLARMRANRGEIVALDTSAGDRSQGPRIKAEAIVVLQDQGSAAAAEAFLLQARQSTRVVTMGSPSKGSIDYQRVAVRTIACDDFRLDLGWPTALRSPALELPAMNAAGVPPDVRLPDDIDWLQYAQRWLRMPAGMRGR